MSFSRASLSSRLREPARAERRHQVVSVAQVDHDCDHVALHFRFRSVMVSFRRPGHAVTALAR